MGITAKQTDTIGRENITKRIISMLDVKFESEESKSFAIAEYKGFIRDYELTATEIFAAYKMALREQLFDENQKRIDIYPNLSLITAGKVLNSYLKFKNEDKAYEVGKSKIKAYLNPSPPEPTAEQKKEQRERLVNQVEECISEHGICEYAFLIYEEIVKRDGFAELRATFPQVYDRQFKKFIMKIRTAENYLWRKNEIPALEKKHAEIMARLTAKERIKKSEFEGVPFQLAKNELVEKYYKNEKQ